MNITVSRVKKDGVCHVSPLPDDLPRPDLLSQGLKSFSSTGQNATIKTVSMRWTRGPEVDKTILRKEVRDFCGQFPVYQLVPFNPDLVSAFNSGRVKRSLVAFPLCNPKSLPGSCNPMSWLWSCKIRDTSGVYYLTCKINALMKKLDCGDLSATDHRFNSFVCCNPKCP
ncbi:uncharacterized protein LOC110252508 [Exaiptasia diaphana]|uniref:Uncharacterized protein n=1 Tax=Exaiptasia diaphana TaxID=2652724 RepID=A0A913YUZ1_EXADI|nr:uncharacterized protein LOC110252508 [Exaiptasia diaphana]